MNQVPEIGLFWANFQVWFLLETFYFMPRAEVFVKSQDSRSYEFKTVKNWNLGNY